MISRSKFGDCKTCGTKNTDCVKRGKELICLRCAKTDDMIKQQEKAKKRDSARRSIQSQLRKDYNFLDNEDAVSRQQIKNDLDYVVSRIVRLMASDSSGIAVCYTCDCKKHWTLMQCSHFIKRAESQFRYDLKFNTRCACKHCNENLDGNLSVYGEKLKQEFGDYIVDELHEKAREVFKVSTEELKQQLIDYRKKLSILEQKITKA